VRPAHNADERIPAMNNPLANTKRDSRRLLLIIAALFICTAAPLFSNARTQPETAITVVNSSTGREIRHLYLSSSNEENWGGDQLNESIIHPGESFTLSNVSCTASDIKVIGEDQDGCFLSAVVSCEGAVTWTISNATAADCGL
jgi:hypothetical protein